MRLDVGSIVVEEIEFGARTALNSRTLVVDRDEIRRIVLEDRRFADVEVHIARPGESVRIVHARDVVEPRWKVAGPGGVFPGFVSPPTTVGEGRTHRLAGVAVVEAGDPIPAEAAHFRERLIDMAGPGARYSPFGQTLNLVLHVKANQESLPGGAASAGTGGGELTSPAMEAYNRAVMLAGMKVATHLGRASRDAPPDEVETFALPPCDPALLRVVCIYQQIRRPFSQGVPPFLYGVPVALPLGTVIHPNECFDGALTGWRGASTQGTTYWEQNNEVLKQLCRRHGRDLRFLGCILFGDITPHRPDKERLAGAVARQARLLGARAALFVGFNGSNHAIDLMWTIQQCEQAGIKTTLIYQDVGHGLEDPGFIFSVPEADAIVCTGSLEQRVTLPPVQQLLGGDHLVNPTMEARGELTLPIRYLHSAIGVQGYSRLTTRFA